MSCSSLETSAPCKPVFCRLSWLLLLPLALLAVPAGHLYRQTAAATEDSVGFIAYSRRLSGEGSAPDQAFLLSQRAPWARQVLGPLYAHCPACAVLTEQEQHPGYPLALLAVQRACGALLAEDEVWQWLRAGQLTSLAAGALLVVGLFLLGRSVLGTAAGLVAATLLATAPAIARQCAAALSDAPALACLVLSAWAAVRALQTGRVRYSALCGLCGAVGYLFRPEALQVTALLGLVHAVQLLRGQRQALAAGLLLAVPVLLVCSPYMFLRGRCLTKNVNALVEPLPASAPAVPAEPALRQLARGCKRFVHGWVANVGWPILAVMVAGCLACLRASWRCPEQRLLLALVLLNAVLLPACLFARRGYLDHRHVLPAVCLASVWCWPGLVALLRWRHPGWAATAVLALAGVATTWQNPLHGERHGFRQAGEWLHTQGEVSYLDPEGLASFFAGRFGDNLWPTYQPRLTLRCLEHLPHPLPATSWLVVSDRYLEQHGLPDGLPTTGAGYRVRVVVSFQASLDTGYRKRVRVYGVEIDSTK